MSLKEDIRNFYHCKDWYKHSQETIKKLYGDNAKKMIKFCQSILDGE